ncbi:putative Lipopolysaccharide-induced tumor necrosis factor-alpha factor-like protein [Hypsibius exemplaris]|uniref:Lipopolysaccharide-induced tumor necrosis factor-alpha factor-like protein n=1 Tax=Hypsibius exemplaris TaxID=2072580 RepID=A0A1W0WX59_HYPEX|nr:putative Lipopolysaccharide-induced tumor necrosis factor-alpha factor-like protein [Hypsibius exemplaris]
MDEKRSENFTGAGQHSELPGGSYMMDGQSSGQVPPPYPVQPYPVAAGGLPYAQTTTITHTSQPQAMSAYPHTHHQTVVFAAPGPLLGPNPSLINCPTCSQKVMSVTQYENGLLTWLGVGGLCLIGCWAGCCLIPLCINDTKDVVHTCPNCGTLLGRYKRL